MQAGKTSVLGCLKIPIHKFYLICLFIFAPAQSDASKKAGLKAASYLPDSTFSFESKIRYRVYHENIDVSTSFSIAKNSLPQYSSFFQFTEFYRLGLKRLAKKSELDVSLDSEIGYKYYLDSVWELNQDRFDMSIFRFEKLERRFRYTYSLQINTSLLPRYKTRYEQNDSGIKLKSGGLFDPGELCLAYGFAWSFWDFSFLNVSLATIKVQSVSKYIIDAPETSAGYYKKEWKIDYGLSVNLRINHRLSERIQWLNQSRLFFNSLDKTKLRLSIQNQIEYRIIRFVKLSLSTRIDYFPVLHTKVQIVQEFRLGFEWRLSPY